MRIPREFDAVEIRVLGALMEKEQATPEYYPLTLKALVAACNQKSNRSPVMELVEHDVQGALERLHDDVLVWPVQSARAERWRHNLDRRWELEPASKAIMTLLMVRGAQTPGELRGRSDRLYQFGSPAEVELNLQVLGAGLEPLVVQLGRRPGQKESRWMHLLAGAPDESLLEDEGPAPGAVGGGLAERVGELEDRVAALEQELGRLRELLE